MADDVEVPEITKTDRKEAMFDPVYEGYIKDNINSDYVDFQELVPAGNMIAKQTFFDNKRLNGRDTIDDIMSFDDENGYETLVTQMNTWLPVYDVGDSKYYVAYVDTMHNDSRSYVIDHEFAYNNLSGEVLDDCIYDYDTGIAYINKNYFLNDDGEFVLDRVQIQLGQVIDYSPQYTESVVLDGMADNISVDSFDIFIGECTFYVDKGLDSDHMNVWLNGGPCLYEYEYDPADGSLTLQVSSALVNSVYVEDTRNAVQTVLNTIFPFTVAKAETKVTEDDMDVMGEIVLKKGCEDDDVAVGKGGKESATVRYWNNSRQNIDKSEYPYKRYSFSTIDTWATAWAKYIRSGSGKPSGEMPIYEDGDNLTFFSIDVDTLTSKNLPFKWDNILSDYDSLRLPMQCSHIGEHMMGGKKVAGGSAYKNGNVWCRILKKWKKSPDAKKTYIILGITTGTFSTTHQSGVGLVKLYYEDPAEIPIELNFKKVFNHYKFQTFDVDGLETYDLTGTRFGIYKTKEQAKNAPVVDSVNKSTKDLDKIGDNGLLKILKIKNDEGYTGTWKLHKNPGEDFWRDANDKKIPNVIYVVELKAGNGYQLPKVGPISDGSFDGNLGINIGGGAENRIIAFDLNEYYTHLDDDKELTLEYTNSPLRDPGALTLFKTRDPDPDITTIEEYKEKRSDPSMNGAKFKLEYWAVDYENYDDDIRKAVDKISNGFVKDLGKPDDGDTVIEGGDHDDIDPMEPDCEMVLQTIHHDKYGDGYLSIQNLDCIVSGEWRWKDQGKVVMPIGVYRFTEIEPPRGYILPKQTEFFASCKVKDNDNTDENITGSFTGRFEWADASTNFISISQIFIDYNSYGFNNSYKFHPYWYDEVSPLANIGTLKIDKDTGKPGKPDNGVLNLAGIEFGVWLDTDDKGNEDEISNPFDENKKIKSGEQIEGVVLVTDENGCADTTGLNMNDSGVDFGVLPPGHNYILKETKSNDSFFLNKSEFKFRIPDDPEALKYIYPKDGSAACYFPTKDGGDAVAHKEILSAKDAYDDYSKNKDDTSKWKLDYNKITLFENESPRIGVGISKFDIMLDSSELGENGKATHGNSTLDGHTYVVLNGTKSEVRLNDKKTTDGKGTKIKSIWAHGDHLKNPYAPTYDELYHYAEESDFKVDPDGNGYICAVLVTDKLGNAETAKDLLPLGVYYVIEVDTKITDEGYHDYMVNKLDVGHVGEYEPGPEETDEDGKKKDTDKYVLKKDGFETSASDIPEDGQVFQAAFTQELKEKLYRDEEKSHSDAEESADMTPRGGVRFQKYNYNSDDPYATGDADLSGARFAIINVSDEAVKNKDGVEIPTWKGKDSYVSKEESFDTLKWNAVSAAANSYTVQEVVTQLVDDSDNKYGSGGKVNLGITGEHDLPFGDYLLIEIAAPPKGYMLNKEWIGYFEIREDGKIVDIQSVTGDDHNMDAERQRGFNNLPMKYMFDETACRDKPYSIGIAIEKLDYEMKRPFAQGKASLKGAMYAVINASNNDIATEDGRRVTTIQRLNDYSNDAVSYKYLYDIYRNDLKYSNGQGHIVTTFETDHRGFASTARNALPSGTYYVIEVKASPGYWIDEKFVGKVVVRNDNDLCIAMTDKNNPTKNGSYFVNVTYTQGYDGEHSVTENEYEARNKNSYVYEPVKRSDIWFKKLDENGQPKANIPFLISYVSVSNEANPNDPNNFETVLESHVIVSDSNGVVRLINLSCNILSKKFSNNLYPPISFN